MALGKVIKNKLPPFIKLRINVLLKGRVYYEVCGAEWKP